MCFFICYRERWVFSCYCFKLIILEKRKLNFLEFLCKSIEECFSWGYVFIFGLVSVFREKGFIVGYVWVIFLFL